MMMNSSIRMNLGSSVGGVVSSLNSKAITNEEWLGDYKFSRSEMNSLIMNYLVTEGYGEAAEKFRDEAEMQLPSTYNADKMSRRNQIRENVLQGKIIESVELINEFYPELLDINRNLHFTLLQQQLIELIRSHRLEEALHFAQNYLAEKGEEDSSCLGDLERTLALLVFEKPELCPFSDLLSSQHLEKVATAVNDALLECDHVSPVTQVENLTKLVSFSQELLDRKLVAYPKIVDFENAALVHPKSKTN